MTTRSMARRRPTPSSCGSGGPSGEASRTALISLVVIDAERGFRVSATIDAILVE
jgi:hypothetical protein